MSIYGDSIRRTQAFLKRELFIGRGKHTRSLYYLEHDKLKGTHTSMIGSPGYGKSRDIEHLLRECIGMQVPGCVVEPHGELAAAHLQFLLRNPRLVRERRIVHFKPSSPYNGCGFNPFACTLPPGDVASLVLEGFMKVWGQDSFDQTPRLEGVLRNTFHVLAANHCTLSDAFQFLLVGNRALRQTLLSNVPEEGVRSDWMELERLPLLAKQERFESSLSRVRRVVLETTAIKRLFEREDNGLDFDRIFRRREVLVADLSGLGSTQAESLIGAMLVNGLYHAAKRRPEPARTLSVLAIDEFPQFVSSDLARCLDQFRKFGVHLILAHQRLAQLSDDMQSALNACAKIKVVFGGLSRGDAEVLAPELFSGEVRGDRIKHITYQTKFRPLLLPAEIESYTRGGSEGDAIIDTSGDGSSWGETQTPDDTSRNAISTTHSWSGTSGRSMTHSRSWTRSVANAFVTEHEEFVEETGRTYWTVEEEWEQLTARLMNLDQREAIVKVYNSRAIDIETPDVEHLPPIRRVRKSKPRPQQSSPDSAVPPEASSSDPLPEDFHE